MGDDTLDLCELGLRTLFKAMILEELYPLWKVEKNPPTSSGWRRGILPVYTCTWGGRGKEVFLRVHNCSPSQENLGLEFNAL